VTTLEIEQGKLDAEIALRQGEARDYFYSFRIMMHPNMLTNWWTKEISWQLQWFYEDLIAGKRPKLALEAPPQHGKSRAVEDFVAWVAGKNPDLKTIFSSYSDELGNRANLTLQRSLKSAAYQGIFGRTAIEKRRRQLGVQSKPDRIPASCRIVS
jgi:hypothetical protein